MCRVSTLSRLSVRNLWPSRSLARIFDVIHCRHHSHLHSQYRSSTSRRPFCSRYWRRWNNCAGVCDFHGHYSTQRKTEIHWYDPDDVGTWNHRWSSNRRCNWYENDLALGVLDQFSFLRYWLLYDTCFRPASKQGSLSQGAITLNRFHRELPVYRRYLELLDRTLLGRRSVSLA